VELEEDSSDCWSTAVDPPLNMSRVESCCTSNRFFFFGLLLVRHKKRLLLLDDSTIEDMLALLAVLKMEAVVMPIMRMRISRTSRDTCSCIMFPNEQCARKDALLLPILMLSVVSEVGY